MPSGVIALYQTESCRFITGVLPTHQSIFLAVRLGDSVLINAYLRHDKKIGTVHSRVLPSLVISYKV